MAIMRSHYGKTMKNSHGDAESDRENYPHLFSGKPMPVCLTVERYGLVNASDNEAYLNVRISLGTGNPSVYRRKEELGAHRFSKRGKSKRCHILHSPDGQAQQSTGL